MGRRAAFSREVKQSLVATCPLHKFCVRSNQVNGHPLIPRPHVLMSKFRALSIGHSVLHIEWCFFEVGFKCLPCCIAHTIWLWLWKWVVSPHDSLTGFFLQAL